jgi:hypothetical protein
MNMTFPYQITNIRTNSRKPGLIYASIVNENNELCVNATLDYCIQWIYKMRREKFSDNFKHIPSDLKELDRNIMQQNKSTSCKGHPGFGPEADPDQDYEGENTFGPN